MKCPECNSENTYDAKSCKCGYVFSSKEIEESLFFNLIGRRDLFWKRFRIFFGLFLLISFIYIYYFTPSYSKLELLRENPTSFIFDCSYSDLVKTIENTFPDSYYRTSHQKDEKIWIYKRSKEIEINFSGDSPIYIFSDGSSIPFSAEYDICFVSLDSNKTKIDVKYKSYTITLGERLINIITTPLGHGFLQTKDVDNTTIEEYKVLLEIGKQLGVQDSMPILILPN